MRGRFVSRITLSAQLDFKFWPFFAIYRKNFLLVDIFYQELAYQQIEQHPAFEFLSLLSEIGGFLGPLLGASVLTVCELVDYLSSLAVRKF